MDDLRTRRPGEFSNSRGAIVVDGKGSDAAVTVRSAVHRIDGEAVGSKRTSATVIDRHDEGHLRGDVGCNTRFEGITRYARTGKLAVRPKAGGYGVELLQEIVLQSLEIQEIDDAVSIEVALREIARLEEIVLQNLEVKEVCHAVEVRITVVGRASQNSVARSAGWSLP